MPRPRHPERQRHRGHDACRQRDVAERVAPRPLLAVDGAECKPSHGQGDDGGPHPVERRGGRLVATLRHVLPGRPRRHRDQGKVDEKGRSPRDRVDQNAADHGPEDGRRARCAGPCAERAALLLAREVGGEERQRARDEQGSGGPLEDPEQDEQLHVRGQAAQRRGDAEAEKAGDERALATVEVVDRARQDQKRAQRQQVGVVDVRLALEDAKKESRQVAADAG